MSGFRASALFVTIVLAAGPVAGQQPSGDWSPARLSDGRPDLQGVWDFKTATPLERPATMGDREILTDEEAAVIESAASFFKRAIDGPPRQGTVGAYNSFWVDVGTTVGEDRRSSLIVDPPDGRLPALVAGAERQIGSLDEDLPGSRPVRLRSAGIGADGPEDRGLAERCLLGFNAGPPMMPSLYNNHMQLFQSSDHVVILNEMVHDARVVPLDGRPHLSGRVRSWTGDSRGRWEGDTLVIETTNFTDKTASFEPSALSAIGTGGTLRLTERFTRIGEETLLYEYTVDAPDTFTRPFTVSLPMQRADAPIFEYACHEGNYGMVNLLSGGRAADASAP